MTQGHSRRSSQSCCTIPSGTLHEAVNHGHQAEILGLDRKAAARQPATAVQGIVARAATLCGPREGRP